MAKFIIQNKIYDTSKMKLIGKVKKWYKFTGYLSSQLFGAESGTQYECLLFRSEKGNWLLVHVQSNETIGEAISEKDAKDLLMRHDYAAYVREYGELEEA